VEPDTPSGSAIASADDIRVAIEAISEEDGLRLERAARLCLPGTEFKDPKEILNEAVVRALSGTRRWPHQEVPFVVFMIMTMKSIADGSREAPAQSRTESASGSPPDSSDDAGSERVLARANPSIEDALIEVEETDQRRAAAAADALRIDKYFDADEDVSWIILCYKEGRSPSKGRELAGMDGTHYETARKRFRRGLLKLFPGRSQS
jgi:hypothetical protein